MNAPARPDFSVLAFDGDETASTFEEYRHLMAAAREENLVEDLLAVSVACPEADPTGVDPHTPGAKMYAGEIRPSPPAIQPEILSRWIVVSSLLWIGCTSRLPMLFY